MNRLRRGLVTGLTLAAIAAFDSARPLAHHSFAMYDQSITYVFTGVVERHQPRRRPHPNRLRAAQRHARRARARRRAASRRTGWSRWAAPRRWRAKASRSTTSRAGRYSASGSCRCETGSVAGRGSRGCSSAPRASRRHPVSTATRSKARRRTAMGKLVTTDGNLEA